MKKVTCWGQVIQLIGDEVTAPKHMVGAETGHLEVLNTQGKRPRDLTTELGGLAGVHDPPESWRREAQGWPGARVVRGTAAHTCGVPRGAVDFLWEVTAGSETNAVLLGLHLIVADPVQGLRPGLLFLTCDRGQYLL